MENKIKGDEFELRLLENIKNIAFQLFHIDCDFTLDKKMERLYTNNDSNYQVDLFGKNKDSIVIVECKNYKTSIKQGQIAAFITKIKEISLIHKKQNIYSLFICLNEYEKGTINYITGLNDNGNEINKMPNNFESLKLLQAPMDNIRDYVTIIEWKVKTSSTGQKQWEREPHIVPKYLTEKKVIDKNFGKIEEIKRISPLQTVRETFREVINIAFNNIEQIKNKRIISNVDTEILIKSYDIIAHAYMEMGEFVQAKYFSIECMKLCKPEYSHYIYNSDLIFHTSEYNIKHRENELKSPKNKAMHPGRKSAISLFKKIEKLPFYYQLQPKLFIGKKIALYDEEKEAGLKLLKETEQSFLKIDHAYGLFLSYFRLYESTLNEEKLKYFEMAKAMIPYLDGINELIAITLINKEIKTLANNVYAK